MDELNWCDQHSFEYEKKCSNPCLWCEICYLKSILNCYIYAKKKKMHFPHIKNHFLIHGYIANLPVLYF